MAYANKIIEYAHKIEKNTADFTVKDLQAFMKIWMKEKSSVTPEQRTVYNQDVAAMKIWRENEKMAKHTTGKFKDAQMSRLSELGIESPINDGKEEIIIHAEEVVCDMGLTRADVIALQWALSKIFEDYDLTNSEMEVPLKALLESLESI
jgi:hypothetical protein